MRSRSSLALSKISNLQCRISTYSIDNTELAVNNPFRYRGYYYDVESGLYYLNSRYYDHQNGIYHANFDCWQWLAEYNDIIIVCSISVHMCVHTEPNLLRVVFTLKFTNHNMYDAFTNTHLSGNWIYFNSSQTAVLIF